MGKKNNNKKTNEFILFFSAFLLILWDNYDYITKIKFQPTF